MTDHWHVALAPAEGWVASSIIHRGLQEDCTVCADVREVGVLTEENQDSDSPRREPTVELMRQRRDAWRARFTEEHEKARLLERAAAAADEARASHATLRQQYRLVHGYWLDTRTKLIKAEEEIARLRELIADQIGEMGQQIERKLPRSLGMGRGPADLSQREEPES